MYDPGGGGPPLTLTQTDILANIGSNNVITHGEMQNQESQDMSSNNNVNNKKRYQRLYKNTDPKPYIVNIESNNVNIGKYSAMKIAKEICDMRINSIVKTQVKGRNKISVEMIDAAAANEFVLDKRLLDKGLVTTIPYNNTSCKGVVKKVDLDFEEETLQDYIYSPINIINITRLNRRALNKDYKEDNPNSPKFVYLKTSSILITFDGTYLPKEIKVFNIHRDVVPYIPPVTQCYACLLYGHTKKLCKGKPKCFICTDSDHQSAPGVASSCIKKCYHCKSGEHTSTSKQCPEYQRQTQIKKLMVFENISYQEANNKCPKQYTNERDFQYNPMEHPPLPSRQQETNNRISIMQRREVVEQQPGFKRTYDQVVRNQAKKRNTQDAQPYNKSKHNEALLNPNGRSPSYKERINPSINPRTQAEPINTIRQTTKTPSTQQTQPPSADHRYQNRMFSTKEDILKYFKEMPNNTIQLIVKTLMPIIINSQEILDDQMGSDSEF